MPKYALFIGRWQPFHNGHKKIIQDALDAGKKILIACRDTPVDEGNPYTVDQRVEMIRAVYKYDPVKVIGIPDIESINIGRKVGYDIIKYDVPQDIAGISATEIRRMMEEGDDTWKDRVPGAVARYITGEKGQVIWLTGWSGSGKSTIAEKLAGYLALEGRKVKVLDGDDVRTCLTSDLGFSKHDRDENIKRISFTAKCIADVGGTAIVAAISPYREARERARELIGKDKFVEVFVKADLEVLKERDPKGLYAKALNGEIENFTGISDPYEDPENPTVTIDTGECDNPDANAGKIIAML